MQKKRSDSIKPIKTNAKKKNLKPKSSKAPQVIIDFFTELSSRAKYNIKGEKPLAVLAVLQYLKNTKQMGIRFLDLLDYPYYEKVRKNFIELAEQYSSIVDPSSSWNIITGVNMELQISIKENSRVDQAVADLSPNEIEKTYNDLMKKYQ